MNFSKLILGLYTALFVGVTLWAGSFFVQVHRDYTALKAQETANERRLSEAENRLQAQEKYLVNAIQSEASGVQLSIKNDREGNFQYVNAIAAPLYIVRNELEGYLNL